MSCSWNFILFYLLLLLIFWFLPIKPKIYRRIFKFEKAQARPRPTRDEICHKRVQFRTEIGQPRTSPPSFRAWIGQPMPRSGPSHWQTLLSAWNICFPPANHQSGKLHAQRERVELVISTKVCISVRGGVWEFHNTNTDQWVNIGAFVCVMSGNEIIFEGEGRLHF